MKLDEKQRENLSKYFFDLSKIVAGIYVFTTLPDKPLMFILGLAISLVFLILRPTVDERIIKMSVTLIFLGIALVALFWVYRITRKTKRKDG